MLTLKMFLQQHVLCMCRSRLGLKITTPPIRHPSLIILSKCTDAFVMSDVLRPGKYYHPTSKQIILLVEIKVQLVVR